MIKKISENHFNPSNQWFRQSQFRQKTPNKNSNTRKSGHWSLISHMAVAALRLLVQVSVIST